MRSYRLLIAKPIRCGIRLIMVNYRIIWSVNEQMIGASPKIADKNYSEIIMDSFFMPIWIETKEKKTRIVFKNFKSRETFLMIAYWLYCFAFAAKNGTQRLKITVQRREKKNWNFWNSRALESKPSSIDAARWADLDSCVCVLSAFRARAKSWKQEKRVSFESI